MCSPRLRAASSTAHTARCTVGACARAVQRDARRPGSSPRQERARAHPQPRGRLPVDARPSGASSPSSEAAPSSAGGILLFILLAFESFKPRQRNAPGPPGPGRGRGPRVRDACGPRARAAGPPACLNLAGKPCLTVADRTSAGRQVTTNASSSMSSVTKVRKLGRAGRTVIEKVKVRKSLKRVKAQTV